MAFDPAEEKTRPFAGAKGDNGKCQWRKTWGFLATYEKLETAGEPLPERSKARLDAYVSDISDSAPGPVGEERKKGVAKY